MQPHKAEQKLTETTQQPTKSRLQIEKLEERIAPAHKFGHIPPGHADDGYYPGEPKPCHPNKSCKI